MDNCVRILLVDDNRMDVELTLDAFRQVRLMNPVHVASNSQEALDYLFRRGQYAGRIGPIVTWSNRFRLRDSWNLCAKSKATGSR